MRTRARQCIAWTLLAFVSVQAGLALCIGGMFPQWRDGRYGPIESSLRRRSTPGEPLVVMLGSSRTQSGFCAGELEAALSAQAGRTVRVANLGMSGGGAFSSLLTLRRLLHDGHRPNVVLIDITPPFFNARDDLPDVNMERTASRRLRPFELPFIAQFRKTSLACEWAGWLAAWSVPSVSFRNEIFNDLADQLVPPDLREPETDEFGWSPWPTENESPELRRRREEATHAAYASRLQGFRLGGQNLAVLRELVETCRREQIEPVIVLTPESAEFQGLYPEGAQEQVTRVAEQLRQDWGITVVDARTWFTRMEFMDFHHLHPDAAREYTRRLMQLAILPRIAGPIANRSTPLPPQVSARSASRRQ